MSWDKCNVVLNCNSSGYFNPGDIVTGSVILEFKAKHKLQNFTFQAKGISKAQWTRPAPTIPYIRIYSQKEVILNITCKIFQELTGKQILPGVYTSIFHFILPRDLPSTFRSSIAKTKYFIKITGKSKWKLERKFYSIFKVLGKVHLNHLIEYTSSTHCIYKTFFKSKNLTINVKYLKGFSRRQCIKFEVNIVNEDKIKISKFKISLVQKIIYTIDSGYANEENTLCASKYVPSSRTKDSFSLEMNVPEIVPSSVHLENPMIEITYILRVETKQPFHFSTCEDIPVTVGSDSVYCEDTTK